MVQLLVHHHAAIDQLTDVSNALYNSTSLSLLPRAHAQGVKQSVCPSVVVVVVGTKITRSQVLGVCACCKHNQSVVISEKLVCTGFELLKKAY